MTQLRPTTFFITWPITRPHDHMWPGTLMWPIMWPGRRSVTITWLWHHCRHRWHHEPSPWWRHWSRPQWHHGRTPTMLTAHDIISEVIANWYELFLAHDSLLDSFTHQSPYLSIQSLLHTYQFPYLWPHWHHTYHVIPLTLTSIYTGLLMYRSTKPDLVPILVL